MIRWVKHINRGATLTRGLAVILALLDRIMAVFSVEKEQSRIQVTIGVDALHVGAERFGDVGVLMMKMEPCAITKK